LLWGEPGLRLGVRLGPVVFFAGCEGVALRVLCSFEKFLVRMEERGIRSLERAMVWHAGDRIQGKAITRRCLNSTTEQLAEKSFPERKTIP
jgi:hypothetical protein